MTSNERIWVHPAFKVSYIVCMDDVKKRVESKSLPRNWDVTSTVHKEDYYNV